MWVYSSCLHSEHCWLYDIYLLGLFWVGEGERGVGESKVWNNRQSNLVFEKYNTLDHKKSPFQQV